MPVTRRTRAAVALALAVPAAVAGVASAAAPAVTRGSVVLRTTDDAGTCATAPTAKALNGPGRLRRSSGIDRPQAKATVPTVNRPWVERPMRLAVVIAVAVARSSRSRCLVQA